MFVLTVKTFWPVLEPGDGQNINIIPIALLYMKQGCHNINIYIETYDNIILNHFIFTVMVTDSLSLPPNTQILSVII